MLAKPMTCCRDVQVWDAWQRFIQPLVGQVGHARHLGRLMSVHKAW